MSLTSAPLQAAVEHGLTSSGGLGRFMQGAGRTAEQVTAWMGDHAAILVAGALLLAVLFLRRPRRR